MIATLKMISYAVAYVDNDPRILKFSVDIQGVCVVCVMLLCKFCLKNVGKEKKILKSLSLCKSLETLLRTH